MKSKIILLVLSVMFLASCQSSMNRFTEDTRGANTYAAVEIGKLSSVLEGVIISIKPVRLSGSKGLGSGTGALLGAAIASNTVGGERDKAPAALIGGLLGAMAGRAAEESMTEATGFEFLVKLSTGKIKAFVQTDKQGLRKGDQVFVIYGSGTVRLTRK
ncbi:hypothetical protein [Candidatus Thiodubiliella endoseptemdiera]|uniref:Glycine zipper 2TM domain-containing protein n=1 Tax=Candidatus Thiodubiliella endoseptemdiera TaxID=2738886 RepID=A0A853EZM9_9GAMM|nr:hypothetical protein [Candidatus Thiodubiliella endoseptemdiera]